MTLFRLLLLLAVLAPAAYRIATDDGAGLDPHGGVRSTARTCGDEGNGFDPHGGPCTTNALDAGVRMDPNG
jgi:hypothetical protein